MASATSLAADWLGINDRVGTVEVGKTADLVLVKAIPLVDVAATRKIAGVVAAGRWRSRQQLDKDLAALKKKNDTAISRYEWKKRNGY